MAKYQIHVQWRSGQSASGKRVAVHSTQLLGGCSRPVHTDRSGVAILDMPSGGTVRVYVDGRDCGKMTPGSKVVTL